MNSARSIGFLGFVSGLVSLTLALFASGCDPQASGETALTLTQFHPPGSVLTHSINSDGSKIAYVLSPTNVSPPVPIGSPSPVPTEQILVYDVQAGVNKRLATVSKLSQNAPDVHVSRDGKRLIAVLKEGDDESQPVCDIELINVETGEEANVFHRSNYSNCEVSLDPELKYAAFIDGSNGAPSDHVIRLWDLVEAKEVTHVSIPGVAEIFRIFPEWDSKSQLAGQLTGMKAFIGAYEVGTDLFESLELLQANATPTELFAVQTSYSSYDPAGSFTATPSPDNGYWILAAGPYVSSIDGSPSIAVISSDGKVNYPLAYYAGTSQAKQSQCPNGAIFSGDGSLLFCQTSKGFISISLTAPTPTVQYTFQPKDPYYFSNRVQAIGKEGVKFTYGVCTDATCGKTDQTAVWYDARRNETVSLSVCGTFDNLLSAVEKDETIYVYSDCNGGLLGRTLSLKPGGSISQEVSIFPPSVIDQQNDRSYYTTNFDFMSEWATVFDPNGVSKQSNAQNPQQIPFWAFSLGTDKPTFVEVRWPSPYYTNLGFYGAQTEWLNSTQEMLITFQSEFYIAKK